MLVIPTKPQATLSKSGVSNIHTSLINIHTSLAMLISDVTMLISDVVVLFTTLKGFVKLRRKSID